MTQPLLIGLIGGVASGKSTVARQLQSLGALWLDSDRMAHEVLNSASVIEQLSQRYGQAVLKADGQVDRQQIARRVFGDTPEAIEERRWLEQLIHPRVRKLTQQRIADEGLQYPAVIIDAPLLIEAGWADLCHRVLLIDTPLAKRQTLAAQRGWSESELARREASQLSLDEKRQRATDIIANDGSLEQLTQRTQQFWHTLRASTTAAQQQQN